MNVIDASGSGSKMASKSKHGGGERHVAIAYIEAVARGQIGAAFYNKEFNVGPADEESVRAFVDAAYRLVLKRGIGQDRGANGYVARILSGKLPIPWFVSSLINSNECRGQQNEQRHRVAAQERVRSEAIEAVKNVALAGSEQDVSRIAVSSAADTFITKHLVELVLAVADDRSSTDGTRKS
jgi:hypothetical protein